MCSYNRRKRNCVWFLFCSIMPCLAKRIFKSICAHNTAGKDWYLDWLWTKRGPGGTMSCLGWTACRAGARPRNWSPHSYLGSLYHVTLSPWSSKDVSALKKETWKQAHWPGIIPFHLEAASILSDDLRMGQISFEMKQSTKTQKINQSHMKRDSDQLFCSLRTGTYPFSRFSYCWVRRAGSQSWPPGRVQILRGVPQLGAYGLTLTADLAPDLWTNLFISLTFHSLLYNLGKAAWTESCYEQKKRIKKTKVATENRGSPAMIQWWLILFCRCKHPFPVRSGSGHQRGKS